MMKVRKGFTLVELLIVIVIIGILAAAMLLSSSSATDSAEASTIISDLRSLKSAALLYYADKFDDDAATTSPAFDDIDVLAPYMDNPMKFTEGDLYDISVDANGKWWLSFSLTTKTDGVRGKLEDRAKRTGLYSTAALTTEYTKDGDTVYMVAR